MRAVLSLYLVFATAAGPVLCCCTTSHAFDFLSAAYSPRPERSTAKPGRQCCHPPAGKVAGHRHHADRASASSQEPSPGPKAPTEPARHCPCQEHGRSATVAVAAEQSRAHSTARDLTTPTEPATACGWDPSACSGRLIRGPSSFGSNLPFLTSAERLYAHHALRC